MDAMLVEFSCCMVNSNDEILVSDSCHRIQIFDVKGRLFEFAWGPWPSHRFAFESMLSCVFVKVAEIHKIHAPKFQARVFSGLPNRRRHADWACQAHKHVEKANKHTVVHVSQYRII